ncbi:hypothetical protein RRG08_000598 [Elysia crispata]|uniref:Uncharacterized protein n=1 Tax=Elysia crispata TaxID=231223 RepID=A0AAE0Y9D1_9GAST|nr:hypothetical protein RRG08_000598 [Elysia crispata]
MPCSLFYFQQFYNIGVQAVESDSSSLALPRDTRSDLTWLSSSRGETKRRCRRDKISLKWKHFGALKASAKILQHLKEISSQISDFTAAGKRRNLSLKFSLLLTTDPRIIEACSSHNIR